MSHSEWIAFLDTQGLPLGEPRRGKNADINIEHPREYDDTQTTMVPLIHQGILSIEGKDSEKFLQGQLSCDVTAVSGQHSCLGTACSPQGRVYSSFRMMRVPENESSGFLLRMSNDITEQTLATLGKYIVFFKSEIRNANDRFVGIGLFGQNSESLINKVFGQAPQEDDAMIFEEETIVVRIPGSRPRFECWSAPERAQDNWRKLAKTTATGNHDDWVLEDIKAGLGEVRHATTDLFVPQMLNFQAVGAISFDKGCYTGQEIVARTQYRGKSKRSMTRLLLTGTPRLEAGINLSDPQTSKNIATVVSAAPSGADQQQALVVILEDAAENISQLLLKERSIKVEQLSLPYSLSADSTAISFENSGI